MVHLVLYVLMFIASLFTSVQATIFDNRYVPFLQRPYIIVPEKPSHGYFDFFFATASQAFGDRDREIGIPELSGPYNQSAVAKSFVALDCPNPLPSRFQNRNILWGSDGKLLIQGFEFALHKQISPHFYTGFFWYFMHVNATSNFFLNITESGMADLSRSDVQLLDRIRREMNQCAGLVTGDYSSQTGLGDLDAYLLWERDWNYVLKFRSIRVQASVGGLFPVGQSRDIFKPTSIPFGGDGFWGAYIAGQVEFEVKEDIKVGMFARASKRFERTKLERIPLHCEPIAYAPLVSKVEINPGPTFVWMGWADFEGVHNGLGARILVTLRRHWQDHWNICCNQTCNCVNLCTLEELSQWGSDYITLNAFYDFGKVKSCRRYEPIVFFAWDIPSNLLSTEKVVKTNKIMLGIEMSF